MVDSVDYKAEYGFWTSTFHLDPKVMFWTKLNPEFARFSANLRPTKGSIDLLFSAIREGNPELLKGTPANMYELEEDTAYLKGIYLDGGGGVWLTPDVFRIENIPTDDKVITYDSHNLDFPKQAIAFQILFQRWVGWVMYGGHKSVES